MRFGLDEVLDNLLISFDIKKVSLQFLGVFIALLCFFLFSWVANYISMPWLSIAWWSLGGTIVYVLFMLIHGALTSTIYKELTSGEKLDFKQSFSQSKKNLRAMVFSPIIFAVGLLIILGIEYLIFMLGKISAAAVLLSVFTIPFILLNALLLLAAFIEILLIVEIIIIDEAQIISALRKVINIVKKAPIQVIGNYGLVLIVGLIFAIITGGLLFAGSIITLSMFGSSSGLFAQLSATEIPFLPRAMQISYSIFSISMSIILGFLISYLFVFLKSNSVSIYLSIKDKIK